jgi:hypothetical protein
LFLPSFRVCGSDVPEEQLFTKESITKPRIAVNHLHKNSIDSMIAKKMESKEIITIIGLSILCVLLLALQLLLQTLVPLHRQNY